MGRIRLALDPLIEAVDTLLRTPGDVTEGATHVRDAMNLKRMMTIVVLALGPCTLFAMWNTGHEAHLAIAAAGAALPGWRTDLFLWLGLGFEPQNLLACFVHGALFYVPLLAVTFGVGIGIEWVFAAVRGHAISEGFFVTGFLFPLILPAGIPLWQAGLGIAFGVILGKEVFGGTGMNFLNPALASRAFLFFAYPAWISGDVWIPAELPDALSGATPLTVLAAGGELVDTPWVDAFLGLTPGSMGETSALLCLVGAAVLLATRVASWRTMSGIVLGTLVVSWLLNQAPSESNPMMALSFGWHVVLGGWAFGTVFMATDPVTSSFTARGQWLHGAAIGGLVVLIRCVNPAYPEGMMLAILFMNLFAPLIDHYVVRSAIRRRARRQLRGEVAA